MFDASSVHDVALHSRPADADVDVDVVAGGNLPDQAVRRVDRDRDRALLAGDLVRDRGRRLGREVVPGELRAREDVGAAMRSVRARRDR